MSGKPLMKDAVARLQAHRVAFDRLTLNELFAADPERFAKLHLRLNDLLFDFSKQRVTAETIALLAALAEAADLGRQRQAMIDGAHINNTEGRAVLHTALRDFSDRQLIVDGQDVLTDIRAARARCHAFADAVRNGTARALDGGRFTDVVNIGIGGSDLGPAMAARALSPFRSRDVAVHFVSNVDGADIADCLERLNPARTLFIVASKTFTTQETMTNAITARGWIAGALGEAAIGAHFAAVSTALDRVAAFGISPDRTFGFWDWVGGRYSLWSAIGLPLAIAIGPAHFDDLLRGAAEVDDHFRTAPFAANIPVLMGLIGIWNRNFWQFPAQAVIPYDQRLARFPAYLQQLDMESNGKGVTRDGAPVDFATAPVIWGEPGTNGQHAFFQCLHQGTDVVPVDFLLAAEPIAADRRHHDMLTANCLAQSEALMRGRTFAEVEAMLAAQGLPADRIAALAPHKVFPGNRPSSTLLYQRLDPHALGRLIALYEHKVFVQGAIWGLNSFDQWGVELGKELASRLIPVVAGGGIQGLDASTAGLIAAARGLRSH